MRISGIENYIGGADNVKALSLIQGEQRVLNGQVLNPDGTFVDITDFNISAKVDFYLADVSVTSRSMSIKNLTPTSVAKTHTIAGITITAETGEFSLTIPKDFYVTPAGAQIPITADISVDVPLAVVYIDYDVNQNSPGSSIRASRMVMVLRRGSPSVGL